MVVHSGGQAALADPGVVLLAQRGDGFGYAVHVVHDRAGVDGGPQRASIALTIRLIREKKTKSPGIDMRRTGWSGERTSSRARMARCRCLRGVGDRLGREHLVEDLRPTIGMPRPR